ncbi:ABC transporter permease subunit [Streptosporangium sp. NPDC050280]|uniref:ABC transporter permease subunit n=1 Tax=unclassified Streptosporangium TaxID=2632669 RepID=UPI003420D7B6
MTVTSWQARSRREIVMDAFRAEFVKLLTLPALCLTALGTWGAALVLDAAFVAAAKQGRGDATSALDLGLASTGYLQAGFIVLGVLAATSEYGGGQIRTSLTSMPRRIELQLVKALALALAAVPVAAVTVAAGVVIAQLAPVDLTAPMDGRRTAQAAAGAIAYLVLTTLIASSLATVARRSLPAVAVLLGYYFIVGPYVRDHMGYAAYLPDTAGRGMWLSAGAETGTSLGRWEGSLLVLAWTLVALATAAVVFERRDA